MLASRPVDGPAIYVEDTSRALRDIARGYRESLPCRCVGITGSCRQDDDEGNDRRRPAHGTAHAVDGKEL